MSGLPAQICSSRSPPVCVGSRSSLGNDTHRRADGRGLRCGQPEAVVEQRRAEADRDRQAVGGNDRPERAAVRRRRADAEVPAACRRWSRSAPSRSVSAVARSARPGFRPRRRTTRTSPPAVEASGSRPDAVRGTEPARASRRGRRRSGSAARRRFPARAAGRRWLAGRRRHPAGPGRRPRAPRRRRGPPASRTRGDPPAGSCAAHLHQLGDRRERLQRRVDGRVDPIAGAQRQ